MLDFSHGVLNPVLFGRNWWFETINTVTKITRNKQITFHRNQFFNQISVGLKTSSFLCNQKA